jgi:hypothetical protein
MQLSTLAIATVQTVTNKRNFSLKLKDRQYRVLFSQPLPAAPLWAYSAEAYMQAMNHTRTEHKLGGMDEKTDVLRGAQLS